MSKWPMVKLGEVCKINPRLAEDIDASSIVSFVPMQAVSEISKKLIGEEARLYSEVAKGYTPFKNGDVLLAKITPCFENGKVALAELSREYGFGSTEFHVFRPSDGKVLDARYLYYSFQLKNFVADASKNMTGSAGQKRVPKSFLESVTFPLPPLPEQKRIVELLDRAQVLIDRRKKQLELMDSLAQSVFYEMFGDPVKNEKGWERKPLEMVIDMDPKNGLYKPQSDYVDAPGGVPILRIDSFYDGKIVNRNYKRLNCTEEEISLFSLHIGDIVINRVNSIEYLGKCAVIDKLEEPTVFESNMMRIRPVSNLLSPFYASMILSHKSTYKQILTRAKKAVNQASINQKDVKSLSIPVPPLPLQQQFAERVRRIEAEKEKMAASLKELENNFNALMQEAFE